MKIIVLFNKERQVIEDVEKITYINFLQIVAATFNLKIDEFDILLGTNVVNLNDNNLLSDFGIISGDLVQVQLKSNNKNLHQTNHPTNSFLINKEKETNKDDVYKNEELDVFVINYIKNFLKNCRFKNTVSLFLPNAENPTCVTLKFTHSNSLSSFEFTINLYKDEENTILTNSDDKDCLEMTKKKVTSLTVCSMIYLKQKKQRVFLEVLHLNETSDNISSQLNEVILIPLREKALGPDNLFLKTLSKNILLPIFYYLKPKDVINIEKTNKFALWKCRSSRLIDEIVWKTYLTKEFGDNAVPSTLENNETYRNIYQQKKIKKNKLLMGKTFQQIDNSLFIPFSQHSPFSTINLNRSKNNPLDPLTGGLIMPQRPSRQPGQPTIYPVNPNWPQQNEFYDPDMPEGLQHKNRFNNLQQSFDYENPRFLNNSFEDNQNSFFDNLKKNSKSQNNFDPNFFM